MDISLTTADIFLLGWAVIATVYYFKEKDDFRNFRFMTIMTLKKLHKGEVELVDNGETFEIKEKRA